MLGHDVEVVALEEVLEDAHAGLREIAKICGSQEVEVSPHIFTFSGNLGKFPKKKSQIL